MQQRGQVTKRQQGKSRKTKDNTKKKTGQSIEPWRHNLEYRKHTRSDRTHRKRAGKRQGPEVERITGNIGNRG